MANKYNTIVVLVVHEQVALMSSSWSKTHLLSLSLSLCIYVTIQMFVA